MKSVHAVRLARQHYKQRVQAGGWTLHGSLRASKVIAGRTALMFIQPVSQDHTVVVCHVMWRASSAAMHGTWRAEVTAP